MTSPTLTLLENGRPKKVFPLDNRLNSIGSATENTIALQAADVQPNHACILIKMGKYLLKNLGQAKSVLVNNTPIKDTAILQMGDAVQIGSVLFRYGEGASTQSPQEPAPSNLSRTIPGLSGDRATGLLSSIVDTVTALLRENQPAKAADKLVRLIGEFMGCDGVRLLIADKDQSLKTLSVFPGNAAVTRFSQSALKWADEQNQTVLVSDIDSQDRLPANESMIFKDIQSVLCAPLSDEGSGRIGYLYLDRLKGHAPFNQSDRSLFERLRKLFASLLANVNQKERQAASIRRLSRETASNPRSAIIFSCGAMADLVTQAGRLAETDIPVLIQGNTGTGKELIADFIHRAGRRQGKPFVAVNCGAIPQNLMESEFFGHVKGAFTGADTAKPGLIAAAHGGTLFLDEISELPLELQVKLLRVLQEREVTALGAGVPKSVDIRVITAANKDLGKEVSAGNFRQDLFFRINVVSLELPPLARRERDVLLLGRHFMKQYSAQYGLKTKAFSAAAEKAMLAYPWPGNIRELENKIQKAILLSQQENIIPADLDFQTADGETGALPTMEKAREKAERQAAQQALRIAGGNVSLAGKLLKMDRVVLTRLLKKLGINPHVFKT